jgi:hypothetical protein
MSIVITGDLSWTGDLVLFLEALDGGPAADEDGYAFTTSGDLEYSCTVTDAVLGLYRCVAKTVGGVIAGAGYVTIGASTTSVRIRSEEAAELDPTRQQALADLAAMITGSGTADAKFDAVALSLAPGGGALTGPFTRTITVTDAADDAPIEAANVRLYRTGETETKPTDADGEASFTTEAATFSYAVTANGYGGVSGTIVISADGATTIELTATAVTPPTDPALSAIEVLCLNANFAAASGIDVDFRMSAVATGDQNRAHPGAKKTVTSNVSGIARFEGPQGATIEWKRGTGQVWTAVTLDNDSVTNVTSLIGSP